MRIAIAAGAGLQHRPVTPYRVLVAPREMRRTRMAERTAVEEQARAPDRGRVRASDEDARAASFAPSFASSAVRAGAKTAGLPRLRRDEAVESVSCRWRENEGECPAGLRPSRHVRRRRPGGGQRRRATCWNARFEFAGACANATHRRSRLRRVSLRPHRTERAAFGAECGEQRAAERRFLNAGLGAAAAAMVRCRSSSAFERRCAFDQRGRRGRPAACRAFLDRCLRHRNLLRA